MLIPCFGGFTTAGGGGPTPDFEFGGFDIWVARFVVVSGTSGTTETYDLETILGEAPVENDWVLYAQVMDDSATFTPTSGYFAEYSTGATPGVNIGYKRMTSSPDTTLEIHHSTNSKPSAAIVLLIRGANATFLDATSTSANNPSGLPDAPSNTPATTGALHLIFGMLDDDDDTMTEPSTTTLLGTQNTGQGSSGVGGTVAIAAKLGTASSAFNPAAFGGTGDDTWRAHHVIVRPA